MKKIILIMFILMLPISIFASDMESIIESQIDATGINELQEQLNKVSNNDYSKIMPNYNIKEMTKNIATGKFKWDIESIIKRAVAFYFSQFYVSIKILLQLIALAMLSALADNLSRSFSKEGVGDAAFFAFFCIIAVLGIKIFLSIAQGAQALIDSIVMFMGSLIPVSLTLLAASGGTISAGLFHPILMMSMQIVTLTVKNILIPLIMIATSLKIADNLSDDIKISKLADLLYTIIKWIMGALLTVFTGIITIQSITAPAIDGLTLKGAKYAVGSLVPVVGSILADSVDLVLGCSLILKNATGVVGLITVIILCFAPMVKFSVHILIFNIASALVQPICDKRIVGFLSVIAQSITIIFVMALIVIIMFIINLTIIIGAGNTAAMLGR